MRVTGNELSEALRRWRVRRETFSEYFTSRYYRFSGDGPGDEDIPAEELAEGFERAEDMIARLEAAQQRYNLLVELEQDGGPVSIALAVKRVGAATRCEKMYHRALNRPGRRGYYDGPETVRDKDTVVARRQIGVRETLERAETWTARLGVLKAGIARANGTAVDLPEVTADMQA